MQTLALAEWYVELIMLSALLYRALRERLLRAYPVFYAYIGFVLLSSLALLRLSAGSRQAYALAYWTSELTSALLGVGVIWEIYGSALAGRRSGTGWAGI